LALAEWCARGTALGLRNLGVPTASVALAAAAAPDAATLAADRVVVLARHRPQQLTAATVAMPEFWRRAPAEIAASLRAAFLRLPQAAEFPGAIELLAAQAESIARAGSTPRELLQPLPELAEPLGVPPAGDPEVPELLARLRAAAAALRDGHRGASELQADLARHAAAISEQKDEMLARAGTIDALKDEMIARERAIMSLREELLHKQAEVDRLRTELEQAGTLRVEVARLTERA